MDGSFKMYGQYPFGRRTFQGKKVKQVSRIDWHGQEKSNENGSIKRVPMWARLYGDLRVH